MIKSYSQESQDLKVLLHYKLKKDGYFLERGASDGINFSNTYLLEQKYNWSGICVEPIKDDYDELTKNRSCHCCDMAVYSESDKELEFNIYEYNLLSGLGQHIHPYVKNNIRIKKKVIVKTITLNDLLEKYNAPSFIEYLSLDTEGSEYEILSVFNFNKYKFGLIHVEHNSEETKRQLIKDLLLQNGYTYIGEYKHDDFYSNQ
jgi:FkbM family methyltransferase